MLSDPLFKIGNNKFSLRHLVILAILVLSFSVSFMLRSQSIDFGYELNEFDPFFNYRATDFIVNNGILEYLQWHDYKSWYPEGRDISVTSQNMLHITAAITYQIFPSGMSLYDYTIVFPVIFGSLTTIVVFALVRILGGTMSGLIAALLFSFSLPVIMRGMLGWFKSEPLGLFYGLLGIYLFVSGIRSTNPKVALLKIIGSGVFLAFGLASWGGNQFFIIPLGIFFLTLPFLRNDHKFQIWIIPIFTISLISTLLLFERPGISFVTGIGGFAIIGPTIFLVACNIVQISSKPAKSFRNGILLLIGTLSIGIGILITSLTSSLLPLPSYRYLNAINPFMTTNNPLVDSVAEHATTTIQQSFFFHSILMIFAGIGIWLLLKNNNNLKQGNDMVAFSLIIGMLGIYISSAFVRLEVFASISIIILGSIGISILFSRIFNTQKSESYNLQSKPLFKIIFSSGIILLLLTPLVMPADGNWINSSKFPPTILNGGTQFSVISIDWPLALGWLQTNTPEDSVIVAWWDYGYWITTVGERTSVVDNATINSTKIKNVASMLLSEPDDTWQMLQQMDADYVMTFVTAQKIQSSSEVSLFQLQGGGDESKKHWFVRIAEKSIPKYINPDGISGTEYFWNNTLLGHMFPYSVLAYYDPRTNQQYSEYTDGTVALYIKEIKLPPDSNGPLELVYASPSYLNDDDLGFGVFIYKVNHEYSPQN